MQAIVLALNIPYRECSEPEAHCCKALYVRTYLVATNGPVVLGRVMEDSPTYQLLRARQLPTAHDLQVLNLERWRGRRERENLTLQLQWSLLEGPSEKWTTSLSKTFLCSPCYTCLPLNNDRIPGSNVSFILT